MSIIKCDLCGRDIDTDFDSMQHISVSDDKKTISLCDDCRVENASDLLMLIDAGRLY